MTTKCALTWARRRWEDLLFPILNMKAISPFFLCEIVAFLDGRVKVTICIDMFSSYSENSTVCRPFYRKVFEEVWNFQSILQTTGKFPTCSKTSLRSCNFAENNARHGGMENYTVTTLQPLEDDGSVALLRRLAEAVADCLMSLHAEQEGGDKVLVARQTRDECSVFHLLQIVLFVVTMKESN